MTANTPGILYLVSTPIGHPDDITLRAVKTLETVDLVICEEYKVGSKLLRHLGIKKDLLRLNEHSRDEDLLEIVNELIAGKTMALISDAGTPVFADPGTQLVHAAIRANCQVVPVPGASSLMAALVCCPFDITEFHYAGFLPRQTHQRLKKMNRLKKLRVPIVIYEAPYRLEPLLQDLGEILESDAEVMVAISLTCPKERLYYGLLQEAQGFFQENPIKEPFVLIINP